jgi:hypothetical protein
MVALNVTLTAINVFYIVRLAGGAPWLSGPLLHRYCKAGSWMTRADGFRMVRS